jgi:hypothetical protein
MEAAGLQFRKESVGKAEVLGFGMFPAPASKAVSAIIGHRARA